MVTSISKWCTVVTKWSLVGGLLIESTNAGLYRKSSMFLALAFMNFIMAALDKLHLQTVLLILKLPIFFFNKGEKK